MMNSFKLSTQNNSLSPGLVVVITVLLFTATGCGMFRNKSAGPLVTVAQVGTRLTSPQITTSTTLIASNSATIKIPRAVTIEEVLVNVGSFVLKNDPILKLDNEKLKNEVRRLKAEHAEVTTRLDKNKFRLENLDRLTEQGELDEFDTLSLEKEVAADDATIKRIAAETTIIEEQLTQTSVGSPIDGLVTRKYTTNRQSIAANEPILEIISVDPILASFDLGADAAGGIQAGDSVKVRIEELPGENFDATVMYVGPGLHLPDRNFTVWAMISNPAGRLKIGMGGYADFTLSKQSNVYVIPGSAIVMRKGWAHVFIIEEGVAKLRRVTVKAVSDNEVLLISGVTENNWVAVRGQNELQDGAIVEMRR